MNISTVTAYFVQYYIRVYELHTMPRLLMSLSVAEHSVLQIYIRQK